MELTASDLSSPAAYSLVINLIAMIIARLALQEWQSPWRLQEKGVNSEKVLTLILKVSQ